MVWRPTALQAALGTSVAVHAALLGVGGLAPATPNRVFEEAPLEVVLVNARSAEKPAKARAIAQANLAGGGNAEQGRITSPLPAAQQLEVGDASTDARRRVEQLQEQQQQLLAQLRRELALLPPPDPQRDKGSPAAHDQQEKRRQLMTLMAEIEKRANEDSAGQRKRYVAADTREEVYALYYDSLRRRIEQHGTRHFPELHGRKLYGELTMNLTVDAGGQVIDAEVLRPSDSKALDQRAVAIVRAAAPYGLFSDAMRHQADQIVVTARVRFTREDGLETSLSARQ